MTDTKQAEHLGWICCGCKKITSGQPPERCHDCGSVFRRERFEDSLCDRCVENEGKRLLDRNGDYDRLCEGCIQELDLRTGRAQDPGIDQSEGSQ